jgi:flagellar motor switch protein FliG
VPTLTGPEKAVLFLLSLDEEVARPIVRELSEDDVRRLRAVAATMREVPAGALQQTYGEFLDRSSAAVAVPRGGLPYLQRLSIAALGESRAREVFTDGVTSPLARIEVAPPEAVAALLIREPPQIVAAILARLEPAAASSILGAMPQDRQAVIMSHVSRMTELPAKVLEDMAAALVDELPAHDASTLVSVDGVAKAAAILNSAGKTLSGPILESMDQADAAIATQVRQAMFTFEDLRRLDPKAMRELLREVPTERLTLALKGASDELLQGIFAGLSSRAADLIRDDLELLGNVRKSEVERARLEVVQIALQLEDDGKLDLGRGDE